MPQTDGQLTKNHHLHPCVNMLQCWDKIEFISESLEGQSKKKKKKQFKINNMNPEQQQKTLKYKVGPW